MMSRELDKKQYIAKAFKIAFILMLCSSLLPWFDRGAYASSFWGFEVVMEHYLWIPFAAIMVFIWVLDGKAKLPYVLFAEAAFAGIGGIYIYSLLYFKRYQWTIYGPDAGMDLGYGLSCATTAFWMSAGLAAGAFVLFQVYLYQKMKPRVVN